MKHLLLFNVVIFLATSLSAFADTAATQIDPTCRQATADPFDQGWRFSQNSVGYHGQCVNTASIRPALVSSHKIMSSIANFYFKGKYWTATWDKSDLPQVQYVGLHFDAGVPGVTAGHTELIFTFAGGLQLKSQTDAEMATIQKAVVSWEATFPKNITYNIFVGMVDNYALSGRVLALDTSVQENLLPDGSIRQFDIYSLKMTGEQGADLFARAVEESAKLGLQTFYRTMGPNCTSQLFDLLDLTLQATSPASMNGVHRFVTLPVPDPILGPAHQALLDRHLISSGDQPQHVQLTSGGGYTIGD